MTKALELAKFGRETPPTGVVVGDSDAQTLSSKTFSDGPVFSGLTANGIPFLNASKVLSSSSTFVFDGTNIGLGIASPAATLHVNASGGGTIRASRSSVGGEYIQMDHDGTDGTLRVSGNNKLNLITNGANRVTITGAGDVILGGATTGYRGGKLVIRAANVSQISTLANFQITTSDTPAIDVGGSMGLGGNIGTDETPFGYISGRKENGISGNYAGYLAFATQNSAAGVLERLRITSTGNVGIGDINPTTLLSIAGGTAATLGLSITPGGWNNARHRFHVPTSGDTSVWSYNYNGSAVDFASYGTSSISVASGNVFIAIGAANTAPTTIATVNSTGLGLGTAPNANGRLTVYETTVAKLYLTDSTLGTSYGGQVRGYGSTGAGGFLELGVVDNNVFNSAVKVFNQATQLSFYINSGANGSTSERLRINSDGNVLINAYSNTGGGKLDITSNATAIIQARSTTTGTGDGTADVTVIRAVTAGASWWANARYDAFSHTWGYSGSATAVIGMRLNGAGNLGIGTTGNTTQKLNVNGAVWLLGNDDANYSTIIEPRYDSSQPFAIRTRNNDSTMVNWLNIYADGGGSNNRIVLGAGGWNVNIGDTGSTGGYKLKVNGTLGVTGPAVISSYASVGSIVANDPGAGYYSYNNRIGGALAVVGTLYNVGTTYANKFTLNQGSTGPTRTAGTVAAGWYRFARSGDSGAGGFGSRGGCTFYMYTTGGWSGPGQTKIELFKDYSTTVNLTVDSKGTYYFTNWRLAMDSNYAYLEGWTNGFNFGGDNTFNTILDSYGWDAGGWTLYTEPLTAGLSSPSGVVRASHINLNGRTMERNIASSANEPDDFVTVNGISWASAFDNPVMDLFTFPTPTTIYPNLIAEVEVWQTPWSNVSTGNAHVGYANYGSQGSIKNVTTMTMKNTMPSGSHGNVGTLSWSGNTLRYTSNRASNYDHYNLKFTVRHQEIHNIQYFT